MCPGTGMPAVLEFYGLICGNTWGIISPVHSHVSLPQGRSRFRLHLEASQVSCGHEDTNHLKHVQFTLLEFENIWVYWKLASIYDGPWCPESKQIFQSLNTTKVYFYFCWYIQHVTGPWQIHNRLHLTLSITQTEVKEKINSNIQENSGND